jgi:hypothetical protein
LAGLSRDSDRGVWRQMATGAAHRQTLRAVLLDRLPGDHDLLLYELVDKPQINVRPSPLRVRRADYEVP